MDILLINRNHFSLNRNKLPEELKILATQEKALLSDKLEGSSDFSA